MIVLSSAVIVFDCDCIAFCFDFDAIVLPLRKSIFNPNQIII